MKKRYAPLPFIAALTLLGGGASAYANVKIYVKNCTSETVTFKVYNSTDKAWLEPFSEITLSGLTSVRTDADAHKATCNKDGKCRVKYSMNGQKQAKGANAESDQYFILEDVWTEDNTFGRDRTKGKYVRSSEDKKCSEL